MKRAFFALSVVVIGLMLMGGSPRSAEATTCTYTLGFQALHDLMPTTVGACLVDEHHNPINGDGLQETAGPTGSGGLLVWRKVDNWTAFTDGYRSWLNGPNGVQTRLNTDRFCWEGDAVAGSCLATRSSASATTASASASGSSISNVASAPGPTALCNDGTYSYSAHHQGTCSWHGGVAAWYR